MNKEILDAIYKSEFIPIDEATILPNSIEDTPSTIKPFKENNSNINSEIKIFESNKESFNSNKANDNNNNNNNKNDQNDKNTEISLKSNSNPVRLTNDKIYVPKKKEKNLNIINISKRASLETEVGNVIDNFPINSHRNCGHNMRKNIYK